MNGKITGLVAFFTLLVSGVLHADIARELDVADESVTKKEVRYSMVGPRDTLIFYTFPEQKVILLVKVGNKTKKFPVSATVHVFPKDTTAEGMGRWLNNQHSDGIFPEVPTPTPYAVAAESCETLGHKVVSEVKGGQVKQDTYENCVVEFKIADVEEKGVFSLAGFTATTQVLVKVEP